MIAALDPREAVLNVARAMMFVRETNGANRGEVVDEMIRLTALDPANRPPWCAAGVAWTGYAALRKLWPLKKVAGCVSLYDDAKAKNLIRSFPERGAIGLIYGEDVKRFRHCYFVESLLTIPSPKPIHTFEFNTNKEGSPEGTGGFERDRTFGPKDCWIHWWLA